MQDFYFRPDGIEGVCKGGTILFDWAHANPIFTAERMANADGKMLWGRALKDKLRRDAAGAWRLQFESFAEYLPNPGTFVDLDPDVKDRRGLPVARITEARHPQDHVATSMLVDRGMAPLRELHRRLLPAQLGRRSRDAHHHGERLSRGLGNRCPMPLRGDLTGPKRLLAGHRA
jgi:hypothetical protein